MVEKIQTSRKNFRKTKTMITVGEQLNTKQALRKLLLLEEEGTNGNVAEQIDLDLLRLNLTHNTREFHQSFIDTIHDLRNQYKESQKLNCMAIVAQLKGSQIRTQKIQFGSRFHLTLGHTLTLNIKDEQFQHSDPQQGTTNPQQIDIFMSPKNIELVLKIDINQNSQNFEQNSKIFIDYGKIALTILEINAEAKTIKCSTDNEGSIASTKFVTFGGLQNQVYSLTEKDKEDLKWCVDNKLDFVITPYIHSASHVKEIKTILQNLNPNHNIGLISRISDRDSLVDLDNILKESDAILISRGSLGVNLPLENICFTQKMIIQKCLSAGKPSILASQILLTMSQNPRPTRAEVSDVINAVFDGIDCVMLSVSASSDAVYPFESVRMLSKILLEADKNFDSHLLSNTKKLLPYASQNLLTAPNPNQPYVVTEEIGGSAVDLGVTLGAHMILCLTESGRTAGLISKNRPPVPVLCATNHINAARRCTLLRGVIPITLPHKKDEMILKALSLARDEFQIIRQGDFVVLTSGRSGVSGSSSVLTVIIG